MLTSPSTTYFSHIIMMLGSARNLCARIYSSVICNHYHLLGRVGDSGTDVRGSDLLSSPAVPDTCRTCTSDITQNYIPVEFIIIKSRTMTLSRSPQCRAFSRAVMDEKSLSPLFAVGAGRGHWLQMTSALHVCRFMTQSLAFIMRRLTGTESASPMESNNCHFYSVFICSKSAITRALR